jgi:uncharacterized membrane-anchored protein
MLRLVLFLVGVAALAAGLGWLADRPGDLVLTWLSSHGRSSASSGKVRPSSAASSRGAARSAASMRFPAA